MIKMTGKNEKTGQTAVMLGLSEGNLGQLRKGRPIHIFGAEMGLPVDIVIFWGPTEDKLAEMCRPMVGPETVIRDMLTNRPVKS